MSDAAVGAGPEDETALDADLEEGVPLDAGPEGTAELDAGFNDASVDARSKSEDAAPDDAGNDGAQRALIGDRDAGVDSAAPQPSDPDPDTWAGPLLGSYVARTDSFTKDTLIGVINRIQEIALVEIERAGSEIWLSAQTCAWKGDNSVGTTRLVRPSAVPARRERVRYVEGRWRTEAGLQALGYNVEPPPACADKEGLSVPKQPGQSWLSDTCRCPSPSAPLPGVLEDCRVSDPDQDSAPGITYAVETFLGTSVNLHAVRAFRFHLQDGVIASSGRHSAHEVQDQQSFQLSCAPTQCANIATLSVPCPPATNLVQMAPLASDGGSATCEHALQQAAVQLAYPAPEFPTTCPI